MDWMYLQAAMTRTDHFWNSLIRQMLLEGLLRKDIEEYGVLKFTKEGRSIFKETKIIQDCSE